MNRVMKLAGFTLIVVSIPGCLASEGGWAFMLAWWIGMGLFIAGRFGDGGAT